MHTKKELLRLAIISYMVLIFLTCITLGINILIFESYLSYIDKKLIDIYHNKIIIVDSIECFENICNKVNSNPSVLFDKPNKIIELFNNTKFGEILLK